MRRILITTLTTAAMWSFAHAQTVTTTETDVFVTLQPTDVLSSNLVGLNVLDTERTAFAEIKDLIAPDYELAGSI